jgi:hypothetical protein
MDIGSKSVIYDNKLNQAISQKADISTIRSLLAARVDPSNTDDKFNTINIAIENNTNLETIKLLLEYKALPSNTNNDFNTAKKLYKLCNENKSEDCIKFQEDLIKHCLKNHIKLLLPADSLDYLFYLSQDILELIIKNNIYRLEEYIDDFNMLMVFAKDFMDTYDNNEARAEKKYNTLNMYVATLNQFNFHKQSAASESDDDHYSEFSRRLTRSDFGPTAYIPSDASAASAAATYKKYIKYKMKYIALKKKINNIRNF